MRRSDDPFRTVGTTARRSTAERTLTDLLYARARESLPEPRLEPTREALKRLGDPQRLYRVVHVAGTNGKTSTSRLIESLLRAARHRTGLFTSPDLGRISQRVAIDGAPLAPARLLDYWQAAVAAAIQETDVDLQAQRQPPLTFFETLTVLGFYAFARERIQVAVIEAGMGGEWDSTNVADGDVAVFTPIGLDHTDRLGSTISQIAQTKSGIIKPGATVVSSAQSNHALAALRQASTRNSARLLIEGAEFHIDRRTPTADGQVIDVAGLNGYYPDLYLPMCGEYQAQNAAVAVASVEAILNHDRPLDFATVRRGCAVASSPGRYEWISARPQTVVDAAHNPSGVAALIAALRDDVGNRPLIGVVGILREKDVAAMFHAMTGAFADLVLTTAPSSRAVSAVDLAAMAEAAQSAFRLVEDPVAAIRLAQERAQTLPGAVVVVFGSITLISLALDVEDQRQHQSVARRSREEAP